MSAPKILTVNRSADKAWPEQLLNSPFPLSKKRGARFSMTLVLLTPTPGTTISITSLPTSDLGYVWTCRLVHFVLTTAFRFSRPAITVVGSLTSTSVINFERKNNNGGLTPRKTTNPIVL